MSIILIRHGATDSNQRTFAGRIDVELNAKGHKQAVDIASQLSRRPIIAVFTSPLLRASQTAEPLAASTAAQLIVSNELQEINFGLLEGEPKSTTALKLRRDYRYQSLPQGESLYQVRIRLRSVLQQILVLHSPGIDVAVIGHYWSCKMLFGLLSGKSFAQACERSDYKPDPGEWVELDIA